MTGDDDTLAGTLPGLAGAPVLPDLIATRYRIVRWLGGGGMGRVYEVLDTELAERVALKVLRSGLAEEAIERLRREVRLTRKIQHRKSLNWCRWKRIRHWHAKSLCALLPPPYLPWTLR